MPRSRNVKEWIGRSDDAMPPRAVFDRLWTTQEGNDAITGLPFQPGDKVVRDHIVPLADGGEHAESNLRPVHRKCHRLKTAREAHERAKTRSVVAKTYGFKKRKSRPLRSRNTFRPQPSNTRDVNDDLKDGDSQ